MARKWRPLFAFAPWAIVVGSAFWFLHSMPQRGRLGLPLIRAAWSGDVAAVKDLLDRGADVNATYVGSVENTEPPTSDDRPDRSTPLLYAADLSLDRKHDMALVQSHIEVMKLLIAHGADVNIRDHDGKTALMNVVGWGDADIVETLLDRGADVNARWNGWTALMEAAGQGDPSVVKTLLDRGADVNARERNVPTALICAAQRGDPNIVKLLLSRGADVHAAQWGKTSLRKAKMNRHTAVVRLLKEAGADR